MNVSRPFTSWTSPQHTFEPQSSGPSHRKVMNSALSQAAEVVHISSKPLSRLKQHAWSGGHSLSSGMGGPQKTDATGGIPVVVAASLVDATLVASAPPSPPAPPAEVVVALDDTLDEVLAPPSLPPVPPWSAKRNSG
jgi:hypothetical protein